MKLINKIKKVFLVGLATLLMFTNNVFAASYSISLTSDSVIVGNTVSLRITGSNVTGRFNITSSNSNVASPDKSSVWVENDTQYITINTKNTGSATLTITPSKTSATDDPENIKDIKSVKDDLLAYFNNNKKDIINTINDKKVLDDELKESIVENAREYLNGKH